ncbi:segregation and condensation protein B [Enterococcus sp. 7F3_DIV0205]|uniref:Segregation and condensation protein B n=1 Tax=Candidatus Enterococcus palustris TaxID=1834189 RepID=A0AAQ3W6C5_9ENTE|nr:SMC-Scp complex subunit ScpB [Enterococcus sp. 7F3_DIV0205]OTN85131.1 segregation and condensation protein B [Enterococcus sp. 7F3_DIV0205]
MTTVSQVEAILFVVGEEGIGLEELSYLLGLSTAKTYEALTALKERYESDKDAALNILEVGNHFILSTKKAFAPLLKKYAQSPISNSLSQAALETLSIVAYKQPISRVEVDEIRGVQSAGSMQKLVARQLIEEKGRVDGPGRAILYGTTAYFMDYFGLRSLEELPDIQQMEEEIAEELPLDLFFDRYKELNEEEATTEINESEEEN